MIKFAELLQVQIFDFNYTLDISVYVRKLSLKQTVRRRERHLQRYKAILAYS